MKLIRTAMAFAAAALTTSVAIADITIGITLPLTGPGTGLGVPVKNQIALWPQSIAGQKLNVIVADDGTNPTNAVTNVRRFITEDKADLIMGSVAIPVTAPIADVATEYQTPHIAISPVPLPPGKDHWTFRLPQSEAIMAAAVVDHMKRNGVKTIGMLGYADSLGEIWLRHLTNLGEKAGIKLVAIERFARTDTDVMAQAIKLTSAQPDAIFIAAAGSGAAMPHKAIVERGYKGKIYHAHSAATRDLMRLGGKDVEGAFVVASPAIVAGKLPDSNPAKKEATLFTQQYEKAYGAGSVHPAAAHAYDAILLLEKAFPIALKSAKPGTKEFRAALRNAFENLGRTNLSSGAHNWTKDDHWGYADNVGVMLKVVNGDWKVE